MSSPLSPCTSRKSWRFWAREATEFSTTERKMRDTSGISAFGSSTPRNMPSTRLGVARTWRRIRSPRPEEVASTTLRRSMAQAKDPSSTSRVFSRSMKVAQDTGSQ